jgi:hypothetical protein
MKATEARASRFSLFGFCCVLAFAGLQLLPALSLSAQGEAPEAAPKTRREVRRERREGVPAPQAARRAWIGVQLQDRDDQSRQADGDNSNAADKTATKSPPGVEVSGVYPNGPAAHAGVRVADRIQSINGKGVSSSKDVTDGIGALQPAANVQLVVNRQGTEQTLTVTLGDAAAFHPQQAQPAGQGNPQENGFSQGNAYPQGNAYGPDGIPEHAMMLEYNRRNAEQHQRLESQI